MMMSTFKRIPWGKRQINCFLFSIFNLEYSCKYTIYAKCFMKSYFFPLYHTFRTVPYQLISFLITNLNIYNKKATHNLISALLWKSKITANRTRKSRLCCNGTWHVWWAFWSFFPQVFLKSNTPILFEYIPFP